MSCNALMPEQYVARRDLILSVVAKEIKGQKHDQPASWTLKHINSLFWPNQTQETTRLVLSLFLRLSQVRDRRVKKVQKLRELFLRAIEARRSVVKQSQRVIQLALR